MVTWLDGRIMRSVNEVGYRVFRIYDWLGGQGIVVGVVSAKFLSMVV